ncbi:unnamed protein product [Cylindrotheca closterium]|uniref:Uncharacterized protein n=1 Tax=Cylindrotheca closterium TaxID=2856 RepID=A0AAD2G5Z9_9STRA|nr:unnamed protein product [Cylindrotheca closterium]
MVSSQKLSSFGVAVAAYCYLATHLLAFTHVSRGVEGFHFKVFLLRHGQTDANAGGIIQGSADFSRLTDLGKQQARDAYNVLPSSPLDTAEDLRISSIYCSPLTRAQQTLAELRKVDSLQPKEAAKLPLDEQTLSNLREIDFYDWEGKDKLELQKVFPESYRAWKAGDPTNLHVFDSSSNIEPAIHYPLLELWERADLVWDEIFWTRKAACRREPCHIDRRTWLVGTSSFGVCDGMGSGSLSGA